MSLLTFPSISFPRCPVTPPPFPTIPSPPVSLSLSQVSRALSLIYQTPQQPRKTPRDPPETMAQVPPGAFEYQREREMMLGADRNSLRFATFADFFDLLSPFSPSPFYSLPPSPRHRPLNRLPRRGPGRSRRVQPLRLPSHGRLRIREGARR